MAGIVRGRVAGDLGQNVATSIKKEGTPRKCDYYHFPSNILLALLSWVLLPSSSPFPQSPPPPPPLSRLFRFPPLSRVATLCWARECHFVIVAIMAACREVLYEEVTART